MIIVNFLESFSINVGVKLGIGILVLCLILELALAFIDEHLRKWSIHKHKEHVPIYPILKAGLWGHLILLVSVISLFLAFITGNEILSNNLDSVSLATFLIACFFEFWVSFYYTSLSS